MAGYAMAAGAILGGVAGSQKDKTGQTQESGVRVGNATANEQAGSAGMMAGFNGFQDMVNAGPGASDVSAATGASRSLADLLKQYSQQGGAMPTGEDYSNGNSLAGRLFQQQRVGMQQNFMDQSVNANRQAALQGRDMNDPILRMKLAQEQTRQGAMLDAGQNQFAQQYAMQQPFQRLDMASQHANVLGGLASQAMANRQALASMGQSIQNDERNWRLQTGTRWGSQMQESGGGLKGAINGAIAGAGAAASMAGGMGGGAGGAGGGAAMGGGSSSISSFGGGQFGSQGGMMGGGGGGGSSYSLGAFGGGGAAMSQPAPQAQPMNFGGGGGGQQMMYGRGQGGLPFMQNGYGGQAQIGYPVNPNRISGGANGSW